MLNLVKSAAAAALLCLVSYGTAAQAQSRDPYYVLTTDFLGTGMALDVGQAASGNNQWWGIMLPTGTGSGQNWHFGDMGNGWFRMTNAFQGLNACLDVHAEGTVYMDVCGAQIGQRWRIENVNGAVYITNALAPGMCLDITTSGNLRAAQLITCANNPGQRWRFHNTGVYP